jgi:hypothetical protein
MKVVISSIALLSTHFVFSDLSYYNIRRSTVCAAYCYETGDFTCVVCFSAEPRWYVTWLTSYWGIHILPGRMFDSNY